MMPARRRLEPARKLPRLARPPDRPHGGWRALDWAVFLNDSETAEKLLLHADLPSSSRWNEASVSPELLLCEGEDEEFRDSEQVPSSASDAPEDFQQRMGERFFSLLRQAARHGNARVLRLLFAQEHRLDPENYIPPRLRRIGTSVTPWRDGIIDLHEHAEEESSSYSSSLRRVLEAVTASGSVPAALCVLELCGAEALLRSCSAYLAGFEVPESPRNRRVPELVRDFCEAAEAWLELQENLPERVPDEGAPSRRTLGEMYADFARELARKFAVSLKSSLSVQPPPLTLGENACLKPKINDPFLTSSQEILASLAEAEFQGSSEDPLSHALLWELLTLSTRQGGGGLVRYVFLRHAELLRCSVLREELVREDCAIGLLHVAAACGAFQWIRGCLPGLRVLDGEIKIHEQGKWLVATPFKLAVRAGHLRCARLLLNAGLQYERPLHLNEEGNPCLLELAAEQAPALELLITHANAHFDLPHTVSVGLGENLIRPTNPFGFGQNRGLWARSVERWFMRWLDASGCFSQVDLDL